MANIPQSDEFQQSNNKAVYGFGAVVVAVLKVVGSLLLKKLLKRGQ